VTLLENGLKRKGINKRSEQSVLVSVVGYGMLWKVILQDINNACIRRKTVTCTI